MESFAALVAEAAALRPVRSRHEERFRRFRAREPGEISANFGTSLGSVLEEPCEGSFPSQVLINSHSGHDSWTTDTAVDFFTKALEVYRHC